MLRDLFGRVFGSRQREIRALEDLGNLPVSEHDTGSVFPIIVPVECADLDWPGPIERLDLLPFALAWAIVDGNRFLYVSFEQAAYWEGSQVEWRSIAFDNLRRLTMTAGFGEKLDEEGRPFIKVMLQDDGMGPSRLLIPRLFEIELGQDYLVAIPERTCAIAFRADVSGEDLSDVNAMITGCFEQGTEPVSPLRFKATAFWEPASRYLAQSYA